MLRRSLRSATKGTQRIRDRAVQRAGELLSEIKDARGGDRKSENFKSRSGGILIYRRVSKPPLVPA
jgi:hypothetical protein